MTTIMIENECTCFKKSGLKNNLQFELKDSAMMEAMRMATQMNDEFCKKHNFSVVEHGKDQLIRVDESAHGEGCCGGGCH